MYKPIKSIKEGEAEKQEPNVSLTAAGMDAAGTSVFWNSGCFHLCLKNKEPRLKPFFFWEDTMLYFHIAYEQQKYTAALKGTWV